MIMSVSQSERKSGAVKYREKEIIMKVLKCKGEYLDFLGQVDSTDDHCPTHPRHQDSV